MHSVRCYSFCDYTLASEGRVNLRDPARINPTTFRSLHQHCYHSNSPCYFLQLVLMSISFGQARRGTVLSILARGSEPQLLHVRARFGRAGRVERKISVARDEEEGSGRR